MNTQPDAPLLRADYDPSFYTRFKWLGAAALCFMVYCIYDGAIGYPAQRVRALKYLEYKEADDKEGWEAYAAEQGWPTANPGRPKEPGDFMSQYIMAGISGLVGAYMLGKVVMARGSYIEADGAEVRSSWGQTFRFDSVTEIDKRKWRDKGIARVRYRDGSSERRFVVDDFKFVRKPTGAILRRIEQAAGIEKVRNGAPEPDPDLTDAAPAESATADPAPSGVDALGSQAT